MTKSLWLYKSLRQESDHIGVKDARVLARTVPRELPHTMSLDLCWGQSAVAQVGGGTLPSWYWCVCGMGCKDSSEQALNFRYGT